MAMESRIPYNFNAAMQSFFHGKPVPNDMVFHELRHAEKCRSWSIGLSLALVFFLLSTPLNICLLPDIIPLTLILNLGVFLPLTLTSVIVLRKIPPIWLRDSLILTPIVVSTVIMAILIDVSQSPDVQYLPFCFVLAPIFPNVIARLRFPLAVKVNFVLLAISIITPMGVRGIPDHVWGMSALLTLTVTCCTLYTAKQLERAEWRDYLNSLKEKKRREALIEHNRALNRLSLIDHLTGLANRRAFDRRLKSIWISSQDSGKPVTVLMLDIDHFKRLNDRHGHHEGDVALSTIGAILKQNLRPDDLAARYGGEEFAILLPDTPLTDARAVAERVRAAVEAARLPNDGTARRIVTVSIGIACTDWTRSDRLTAAELVKLADEALYDAKALGRNRIEPRADHVPPIPMGDGEPQYFCRDPRPPLRGAGGSW